MLARLPDMAENAREEATRHYLAAHGITGADADRLIAEIDGVLRHPDFAGLFGAQSRAEVAVAGELPELGEGVRVNGQIDRLAVTDETVLIADFKTNRPPPASPEQTPGLYLTQMALYRALLAKIYPGKRIACALIWTVGPRLMVLPEALLDAEIARITGAPGAVAAYLDPRGSHSYIPLQHLAPRNSWRPSKLPTKASKPTFSIPKRR